MSLSRKRKNRRFERRHVLDVKLRSSQRRHARFRRLMLVVIFFTAVFTGGFAAWRGGGLLIDHFIYQNPAFAIRHLEIQTDGVIAREQLRRWSGVRMEENLFALNLARVKRDLELVPAIESAAVERVLPYTLRIRVTEREAVAQVIFPRRPEDGGEQRYLVDGQGYVMFPLEVDQLVAVRQPASPEQLPALTGIPPLELRPGRRLATEPLQSALRLIAAFSRSPMVGVVNLRQIDVKTPELLQVTTSDRCAVVFGLTDFDAQLRRWRSIHDHGRRTGRKLMALDLSVSNNVPARWLENQAGTLEPAAGSKRAEPLPRRNNV